jgi:hypothetical protein
VCVRVLTHTGGSTENRNQKNGTLNGLTVFISCVCVCECVCVRVLKRTGCSTENRNQENGTLNGLTFLHIMCVCVCVCNLPHVSVGDANGLLQLSDILDFKGTETRGNRNLNCLQTFSHISSKYMFPQ